MIALYARVSTDAQIETGLQSQLAELRRFVIAKYPGEAMVEFIDDGYSGETLDRPKMNELLSAARSKAFRVVIAYDPDRLSRDAADLLFLLKEVERAGVTLDFVRGGFEQSDSGRMLLQMRGVIAQYERAQIKARTQRGRLEAARRGKYVGSRPPYGYDVTNGVLKPIETEVAIIKRIFSMVLAGESVRGIARKFNAEGIAPQRGIRWQTSSLYRILTNKTYVGITAYNRRKVLADKKREWRPESEWIALASPILIDQVTFDRTQAQLKRNSLVLSGRNDQRTYMLRGLLRCGVCGGRMGSNTSHGVRYYRCSGKDPLRAKGGRCKSRELPADKLEQVITESVQRVLRGGALERGLDTYTSRLQAVNYAGEIAAVQKQIELHQRTEERAAGFMVAPEHSARQNLFQAHLDRATKQRLLAEERKSALEKAWAAETSLVERGATVRETCGKMLKTLKGLTSPQWQVVLRLLIDEVTITGKKLELRGFLPSEDLVSIPFGPSAPYERNHAGSIPFVFNAEMPKRKVG